MGSGLATEWAALSAPWRAAFDLAWESFQAGSPPVGAVVADRSDRIIGWGRSRRHETVAPVGQLAGSRLAHAEVNALAALPVDHDRELRLYVTLEPCLLCVAAAAISHISEVSFAGSDPMWRFLAGIGSYDAELERRAFVRSGPRHDPIGAFATLLPMIERVARNPTGPRLDAFAGPAAALVGLADELGRTGRARDLKNMTLDEAADYLWPDLVRLADAVP